MYYSTIFAALALPVMTFAAPAAPAQSLPPCSNIDRPCSCPAGTTFKNVTTYAVIGAKASDIGKVVNVYEDTTWFGLVSLNITGKHNTVGETRTFNITANNTWYSLTEELIKEKVYPDGSFVQRYRQNPKTPIVQTPKAQGGGSYHGYWATITAQQTVVQNETALSWYVYRCDIGVPFDTAPAHESSFRNVSTILQKQGKHTGVDIAPFSITKLVAG